MNLSAALLSAYQHTDYIVFAPQQNITLHIARPNAALAHWMQELRAVSFAFISSCNPQSVPHPAEANALRHANFKLRLQEQQQTFYEGVGLAQDGQWQEPSLFLLNIEKDAALAWGRYLEQHAILWGSSDALPQLLLCDSLNTLS